MDPNQPVGLPKTLAEFVKRHADKISDVSDERKMGDGLWIALKTGWCCDPECHILHEYTASKLMTIFRSNVRPCNCPDCRRKG